MFWLCFAWHGDYIGVVQGEKVICKQALSTYMCSWSSATTLLHLHAAGWLLRNFRLVTIARKSEYLLSTQIVV